MGKFVKIINRIGNIIILNIIFILTSSLSLMLCFGTSWSALHATFLDLKTDNSGYYVRNYFKHFKANLKMTLIVDIALILLGGAAYLNFLMINTISDSTVKLLLFAVLGLIVLEILLISSFLFPVIAKFEGDLLHLLYLSFIFAHRYLYFSVLFLVLFFGGIFLTVYVSFAFIFIIFGLIAYLQCIVLKHIWKDYQYEISEI